MKSMIVSLFVSLCVLVLPGCPKDQPKESKPPDQPGAEAPQGAAVDAPPKVLETTSGTVKPAGGKVTFNDATGVVLPPGAVSADVQITVKKLEPAPSANPAVTARVMLSCECPTTQFDKEVELRVPLSVQATEADSGKVRAGWFDEAGTLHVTPCSIRMIDGKPFVVVPTKHFSHWLIEWLFGKTPPASAGPLEIPYYSQAESAFCWAACMQMITQAASYQPDRAIYDIVGYTGIGAGGITDFSFRCNIAIGGVCRIRTGFTPDREQWDMVNVDQCPKYLKEVIGLCQFPVAVYLGPKEHAIVIVGYDEYGFFVNDPQGINSNAITAEHRTWGAITGTLARNDHIITMVIPKAMDGERPNVTVNITNGSIRAVRPKVLATDQTRSFTFRYDPKDSDGYSFVEKEDSPGLRTLPAGLSEFSFPGDIQVANSSLTEAQTVTAYIRIDASGPSKKRYLTTKTLTVPANALRPLKLAPIPVAQLLDPAVPPGQPIECILSVATVAGSKETDREAIRFSLTSEEVAYRYCTIRFLVQGTIEETRIDSRGDSYGWPAPHPSDASMGNVVGNLAPVAMTGDEFTIDLEEADGKREFADAKVRFKGKVSKDRSSIPELTVRWDLDSTTTRPDTKEKTERKQHWLLKVKNVPGRSPQYKEFDRFEVDYDTRASDERSRFPARFEIVSADYSLSHVVTTRLTTGSIWVNNLQQGKFQKPDHVSFNLDFYSELPAPKPKRN